MVFTERDIVIINLCMNNKVKLFNYIFPEIKNKFIPVYCNQNQIKININNFN